MQAAKRFWLGAVSIAISIDHFPNNCNIIWRQKIFKGMVLQSFAIKDLF